MVRASTRRRRSSNHASVAPYRNDRSDKCCRSGDILAHSCYKCATTDFTRHFEVGLPSKASPQGDRFNQGSPFIRLNNSWP